MNIVKEIIKVFLLLIGVFSCTQKIPDYNFPEKSVPGEIITIDRGCYYLPKSYSNDKKYAMVVLLHPIGIDHYGFLDQNEFLEQADKRNYILCSIKSDKYYLLSL